MRARVERISARLPNGIWDVVVQVSLMLVLYLSYRLIRGVIDDPQGTAAAFAHGRSIIDLERSLGIFVEPDLQNLFGATGVVADFASWTYINAQMTVTLAALVYLYVAHNRSFYFVRNMFIVSWCIALAGYTLYPAAPPRFFPEWGFVDSVASFTGVQPTDAAADALFNPYAAVPSMHVAFALMIGVPLAKLAQRRAVRIFWMMYPVLVTFVIVVTANHFLTDAVLGALTAAMAAGGAVSLARTRAAWRFQPAQATAV
ncbi:unannotated protein [freshwater metagenome]|uniref:Unannotated protein n=1 Tax=freshwater metagenome TaxID=449393 RepID=A0A6J7E0A7_9ZZZZ